MCIRDRAYSLSKICKIVLEYTLKCSQLISSSDNKKILLTTRNVGLDSGRYATKYYVLLDLNPPFYEVNQEVWKRPPAWRNFKNIFCVLSKYPKKPFRTEKSSIFNFQYVKEVWATGLLGVKQMHFVYLCSWQYPIGWTWSEQITTKFLHYEGICQWVNFAPFFFLYDLLPLTSWPQKWEY